jgi:putative Mn2+ efflux pump MntP
MITIIFIALGLAMDAFAVSIVSGFTIKHHKFNSALKLGASFGIFQAIMPVIGWLAGMSLRSFIVNIDHWVAFILLIIIGSKMIYESFKIESDKKVVNPLNAFVLLILSISTSIDAFVVGISFAFLNISIITPVIIIGIITFLLSFIGVYIGDKIGHFFETKIEAVGGVFLIGIGIKILIEHLFIL